VKTALLIALAALVAATALAAPASAATPTERRLARQVKTLGTQVKALQKQVKTLQQQMTLKKRSNLSLFAGGAYVVAACATAATADAFQGTWEAIDRHAAYNAHGQDTWPPQTPIADPLNSCQQLEVQRAANPAATPTTDVFAALLAFFR
jgi:outer membrane murein-binding lipoprotein Lpp